VRYFSTRCRCQAKFRVHVHIHNMRWYVTVFEFGHNHVLLDGMMCGLLAGHRKLSKSDIQDIRSNGNVGIRPYQMYGAMANASGGFHELGFLKKDFYKQVRRQKKSLSSDLGAAVKYLSNLCIKDPMIFVRHTVDKDKRLE